MCLFDFADFEGLLSKLGIATARLARKQQNFLCAEKLLIDEIQGCLRFVIGDFFFKKGE